jgi:hypothetical protein
MTCPTAPGLLTSVTGLIYEWLIQMTDFIECWRDRVQWTIELTELNDWLRMIELTEFDWSLWTVELAELDTSQDDWLLTDSWSEQA